MSASSIASRFLVALRGKKRNRTNNSIRKQRRSLLLEGLENRALMAVDLNPGDVSVIGYNTNGAPDTIALLISRDLDAGTVFFVNDNELALATSTSFTDLNEAEASFTVKAGQSISAGTVVILPWGSAAVSTTTYDWSTTASAGLGNNNDEIYIYEAASISATSPTQFIYYAKIGTSPSAVPNTLNSGTTAISPNGGALRYKTTSAVYAGTQSTLLAAIGNTATNWEAVAPGAATDWTFTVQTNDTTPPTVTSIDDGDTDNSVTVNTLLTYTVTFNEDINAASVSLADFDNAGTAAITIGTITETTATSGVFNVQVTPTSTGTLTLRIPTGAVISDVAGNNLVVPVSDNDTVTVVAADTTPPSVVSIDDGDSDNIVISNSLLTYTVSFSEDIDATTVTAADFDNAGTAGFSIGTITETTATSGIFTVQVTPTTAGTLILRIPSGAVIKDAANNDLVVPVVDNDTITVNAPDVTPPQVTSFVDNVGGGSIFQGQIVTYTVTFNEDINSLTVSAADFDNAGTATVTIGGIVETSPGVFTVVVTTTGSGTLNLRIPSTAVIADASANNLVVPVSDDTTITVDAAISNLTAGDVAVIGYNTAGTPSDSFVILTLKQLAAGTVFYVNDNEIATSGGATFSDLAEVEASFTVKAGQSIPAGTVISLPWGASAVDATQYVWSSTSSAGFGNNNEEIYVYSASGIASDTATAFIYGVSIGTSTSPIALGLTAGTTFIEPTGTAARYKTSGAVYTGSQSALLSAVGNTTTNWEAVAPGVAGDWSFSVTSTVTPTVTTTPPTKVYDGTAIAISSTADDGPGGLAADTTVGNFTYTYYAGPNLTGGTLASAPINAGSYSVDIAYAGNVNYNPVASTAFNFTITARPVNVSADTQTKVYGATDPTLTYSIGSQANTGLVGGDVLTGVLSRDAGTSVGSYAITQGSLAAPNSNYSINYVGANLSITPATLTITADAKSKTVGGTDPILTYTPSGLTNGDTTAVITGTLSRTAGETVGVYPINQGNIAAGSNYSIAFVGADFTIIPAAAAPTLTSVAVNGADSFLNNAQRSMVTSLVVTFSSPVTLAVGAFSITNIGLFTASNTSLDSSQILVTANGTNDVYTIRFGAGTSVNSRLGTGVRGNSLADGNYRLTIDPTKVTNAGGTLSGNNLFGASAVDNFFRMYGDSNGDGRVDALDTNAMKSALNNGTNAALDYDGNGTTSAGVDTQFFGLNNNKRRRTF